MTGTAAALATAEAVGARFGLAEGGRLRFTPGEAPAEVVAELRRRREQVAAILAEREGPPPGEHDAAEDVALAAHHTASPDPEAWRPGTPEALRDGLLVDALVRPPSWADPASPPPPAACCACCGMHQRSGGRWWREAGEPRGWRCRTCYPPDKLWPVVEPRT